MDFWKKFKDWLITKLGGCPADKYKEMSDKYNSVLKKESRLESERAAANEDKQFWKTASDRYRGLAEKFQTSANGMKQCYSELESSIVTVESCIDIEHALGYTEDNVIDTSKAQTYYNLGKAAYKYAKHFITPDGKYICAVNVQEKD